MSKRLTTRAAAQSVNMNSSKKDRALWILFALFGIGSLIAGFGRIYRVKNILTGERKDVFSSNNHRVTSTISEEDWEFQIHASK
jgi:hypothetical protein